MVTADCPRAVMCMVVPTKTTSPPNPRRRRTIDVRLVLVGTFAGLVAAGCATRGSLGPDELERVRSKNDIESLSVYASRRLVTTWLEPTIGEEYDVDGRVREASARQRFKNTVGKTVPGQILAIEELNGMPLLWVSFDVSCNEPKCAFGFVQTEDDVHRLVHAPPLEGYAAPQIHHVLGSRHRRMKPGKLASLGEANEVLVNKASRGRVRTIHLEMVKQEDHRVRTRIRRSKGRRPPPHTQGVAATNPGPTPATPPTAEPEPS